MTAAFTSPQRALRTLAMPIALTILADQLLGIVDTIAVSSLGTRSLAAITAASAVFFAVAISINAFSSGPRIMAAQAVGAGDFARFGRILRSGMVIPLALVLAVAVVAQFAAPWLMQAMLHDAAATAAASYLQLRMWSLLPMAVSTLIELAFAATGDTGMALRLLIVVNILHLPLVAYFVLGVPTHHSLGVTGAGLSSLISECAGAGYAIWRAIRRPAYRIFSEPSVDPRLIRATLILSAPQFVFLVLMVVPEPLTIVFLAHLGPTSVAAFRALTIVSDLTWAMPGSIGSAAEIILGQRLGSRDIPGARSFQRAARRSAVMLCGSVAAVGAALAWPLAALVTWSTTLASIAAAPLALHMLTLPLKGYAMTTLAPIRAAGDTRFTMWIGILTSLIVVSLTYIGIVRANFGLWAVPIAWITAWTARSAITTWRLRQRDWERRELAA